MQTLKVQNRIRVQFNPNDYDSLNIGDYIETSDGQFCLLSRPNIYQPLDSRGWVFQQTSASDGEPFMDGPIFKIY